MNVHGQQGKNIPMDLHIEHLNRQCKVSIKALGANVTEHAVTRVGKCLGEIMQVTKKFDSQTGVLKDSMRHSHRCDEEDLQKMTHQLGMF